MTNSSKINRAAGVFVRFRSPDDYYAVRASALENNVNLYRIAAGRREPQCVLDLYRGELAEDISTLWLDVPREAVRRDVLEALDILARAEEEPGIRLRLLERIRSLDPHSEEAYREIMRTQAQLGQHDAISRTATLLAKNLGEIGEAPGDETVTLARTLRNTWPETPAST